MLRKSITSIHLPLLYNELNRVTWYHYTVILKLDFSSKLENSWKLETHYIDLRQIELKINCPNTEYTGNLCVHLSVWPSVSLSIRPGPYSGCLAGWGGRTYGQTDGRTHRFPLNSMGHRPLWVHCPKSG